MTAHEYRSADMASCAEQVAPLTRNPCKTCSGAGGKWKRWCYRGESRKDFYLCADCHGTGQEPA